MAHLRKNPYCHALLTSLVPTLKPTWQQEKTIYGKLSFNFHVGALIHRCVIQERVLFWVALAVLEHVL